MSSLLTLTKRKYDKLERFRSFAHSLSGLSVCKRNCVGCIVFPQDFSQVFAIGYNGPPSGRPNDSCRGIDAVGSCGCLHAECNALLKLSGKRKNLWMYCTTAPCETCASMILQKQCIDRVIYAVEYRDKTGVELLKSAFIKTNEFKSILFH